LLASILENGSCVSFPDSAQLSKASGAPVLTLNIPPENAYFKEQLGSQAYQEQLQNLSKDYFGRQIRFQIELGTEAGESLAQRKKRETEAKERSAREAAQNHPIIREARSLFGSDLGPIELTDQGGPS
jgi:hypothetical protein